jgi:hypothetical protein
MRQTLARDTKIAIERMGMLNMLDFIFVAPFRDFGRLRNKPQGRLMYASSVHHESDAADAAEAKDPADGPGYGSGGDGSNIGAKVAALMSKRSRASRPGPAGREWRDATIRNRQKCHAGYRHFLLRGSTRSAVNGA